MSYYRNRSTAPVVALPARNTRFARKAAEKTNEYRTARAKEFSTADPAWLRLIYWTSATSVGGFLAGLVVDAVAAEVFGPTVWWLGYLVWLAGLLTPVAVFHAGRRATADTPRELNYPFSTATRAIESLRKHDEGKADRLMSELVAYAEPARHAVELDWDTYQLQCSRGAYDALGWEPVTPTTSEAYEIVERNRVRREKYLASSPVAAVTAAVENIATAAVDATQLAVEKSRHADAPLRELEAQIKVERERERMLDLTASYEAAMAKATVVTEFGSADIATESRIGREVIRRLDA